jgi:hypothetical protein
MLRLMVRAYFLGACCACITHSAAGQTLPSSPLPGKGPPQHWIARSFVPVDS